MQITQAGLAALGTWDPLPVGKELQRYWLEKVGKGERLILQALLDAYPSPLTKGEIAQRSGYAESGTFDTYLSRLRTLDLIVGRGEVRASAELFD